MPLTPPRWRKVAESEFPWEREALEFLAQGLPGAEPVRMWSNFEFVSSDGHINEVDALVLTGKGLFLIEIKSRPARTLTGDAYAWTWIDAARRIETDNPLILADRKSKRLASLLAPHERRENVRLPFIETLVFCSAPGLTITLPPNVAPRVFGVDRRRPDGTLAQSGILAALTDNAVGPRAGDRPVDTPSAAALTRCLDRAGVCRARPTRRIAGYKVEERIGDGPLYQDFRATHPNLSVTRRVRLYPFPHGASEELRGTIRRAAEREFRVLESVTHPSLLKPVEFVDSEFGPSLLFDFDSGALRLDHYLRQTHETLSLENRVALIRQIAEAVDFAHKNRRIHRALSPQCILVRRPDTPSPAIQLTNWHAAAVAGDLTTGQPSVLEATHHLSQLVEDAQAVYVAPEASRPIELTEAADVFSLGAVAYFILTGQPPAATPLDLAERLRRGGLLLTDVLDGADQQLTELVKESTAGALSNRTQSVEDFVAGLDLWEEQATAPDVMPVNPADAHAGDELPGGFTVERRLGKGATAVALLVRRDDEKMVLKVALGPEFNPRVQEEAEVLRKLHHQNIVGIRDTLELGGLSVLVIDHAGDRTLARMLREEGKVSLDFLSRFGDDLLGAVDYLEQQGIWHRDIKPENIGIAPVGRGNKLHLVLFDFSLSRTPVEQYRAGTPGYLDPFVQLRRPPQYDLHAERFAAAVTLYEMATGKAPTWGDGSDPAQLDCEVTIDTDVMDAPLREPLASFFTRALARQVADRFENAEDMRRTWTAALASAAADVAPAVRPPATTRREEDDSDARPVLDEATVAAAKLDNPIDQLGLSARAVNALERLGCSTLRDMLRTSVALVFAMRGVGHRTRKELAHAFERYRQRFADVDLSFDVSDTTADSGRASVDTIFARLLPAREREEGRVGDILKHVLALTGPASSLPSQTEVAQRVGVTRAYVSQSLQTPRNRWVRDAALTELRREIAEMLTSSSGVMAPAEIAAALLERRGSVEIGEPRTRHAVAVLRAALEAENALKEPRFTVQRRSGRVVVASSTDAAAYAFALGQEADRLAAGDLLLPPARAVELLRAVAAPAGLSLDDVRLVRLAALASTAAAVSARQEIYARGMSALRSAKLSRNLAPTVGLGLAGQVDVLTPADVRQRVASRFPEAEALPDRPALDAILEQAEWNVEWDAQARKGFGAYRSRVRPALSTSSSSIVFQPTMPASRVPDDDVSASARRFDERLKAAVEQGGFLLLTVPAKYLQRAERELVRQYGVQPVSLERSLIGAMKASASVGRVNWDIVLRADAATAGSPDWNNLQALVARAMTQVETNLPRQAPPALLTYPGLLARYERLAWIADLAQKAGRPDGLHGAWLLVPWEDPSVPASLDGHAIPVLPSQRAHIPDGWLGNRHRTGLTS